MVNTMGSRTERELHGENPDFPLSFLTHTLRHSRRKATHTCAQATSALTRY